MHEPEIQCNEIWNIRRFLTLFFEHLRIGKFLSDNLTFEFFFKTNFHQNNLKNTKFISEICVICDTRMGFLLFRKLLYSKWIKFLLKIFYNFFKTRELTHF